jgi:hypothetical protein
VPWKGRVSYKPEKQENLWITAWSKVLLENLTVAQLVKKLSVFYGIQKFSSVFITILPRDPILRHMNPIHTFSPYFCNIHFNTNDYLLIKDYVPWSYFREQNRLWLGIYISGYI